MSEFESRIVLLSKSEADGKGAEGVYATLRNDYAVDENSKSIYGKEYSYQMFGANLHGPIPGDVKGGFASFEEAEKAVRLEYKKWRDGDIPAGTPMPRHVFWRTEYRRNRYLQNLSADEIAQRFNDVTNNLLILTEEQKIGIGSTDEAGDYWLATSTHIMEECVLREYPYLFPMNQVKE